MQAEKKIHEAQFPILSLIFQRSCDGYQCLILVFSVVYLDSCGCIGWVDPVRVFEKVSFHFFFSSFSFLFFFLFFLFFSFLFFIFFFCLFLGGPFSSGALGHCPGLCYVACPYLKVFSFLPGLHRRNQKSYSQKNSVMQYSRET